MSAETPADRARRLLEGTTEGPWRRDGSTSLAIYGPSWLVAIVHDGDEEIDPSPGLLADVDLMAAAPDLARGLIAETEAHEVTRAALAEALRERDAFHTFLAAAAEPESYPDDPRPGLSGPDRGST